MALECLVVDFANPSMCSWSNEALQDVCRIGKTLAKLKVGRCALLLVLPLGRIGIATVHSNCCAKASGRHGLGEADAFPLIREDIVEAMPQYPSTIRIFLGNLQLRCFNDGGIEERFFPIEVLLEISSRCKVDLEARGMSSLIVDGCTLVNCISYLFNVHSVCIFIISSFRFDNMAKWIGLHDMLCVVGRLGVGSGFG